MIASLHLQLCLLLVVSSFFVGFTKNPINSVIFLILSFLIASFILFFFNMEFLGLIFIIIYVGAIAVLFLFVIMMLNIKSQENQQLKTDRVSIIFVSITAFFICGSFLFLFYEAVFSKQNFHSINYRSDIVSYLDQLNNIDVLGQSLFNFANLCFLLAGLILLIALLGSIVLTQNFINDSKGEIISKQLARSHNILVFRKTS